jgi:Fe-S cluster biogenesis protein NfuA
MTDIQSIQIIEQVLEKLRPTIQMDGGNIEFAKFENNIVYVRLQGACTSCPMSMFTLKMGVEEAIKNELPQVTEVVSIDE